MVPVSRTPYEPGTVLVVVLTVQQINSNRSYSEVANTILHIVVTSRMVSFLPLNMLKILLQVIRNICSWIIWNICTHKWCYHNWTVVHYLHCQRKSLLLRFVVWSWPKFVIIVFQILLSTRQTLGSGVRNMSTVHYICDHILRTLRSTKKSKQLLYVI